VNEEQLRLFIQQAFAMIAREDAVIQGIDPAFLESMKNIRQIVLDNLPDDGILREQQWRAIQPLVAQELQPYNRAMAEQLFLGLGESAPDMANEAVRMIEAVGITPEPVLAGAAAPPPAIAAPALPATTEAVLRTRVNGTRLTQLFESVDGRASKFVRFNLDAINRKVVNGIITGQTTQEIADAIAIVYARQGVEYVSTTGPTAARQLRAEARAVARTAIQDANRQIHNEVYRANAEALADLEWEWVAVLDSRTCPTCAPLDGKRWPNRSDAPTWPVHVNCRCQVIAVDPDEAASVRGGQAVSPEPFTYKGKTWDEMSKDEKREASKNAGIYGSKVKVKGDNLYRKSIQVRPGKDGRPPNYADFLATSNQKTQQMFFGGGNAGSVRANKFRKAIERGTSPDKALVDLINTDRQGVGRFVPVSI
jgi:SPP1 gp7 family putative phage head morphogenesis protein